ncbi:Hypothetical predicted protein [Xyrichtys novacula]|uniref:Uncharacterized protein n=1 Tax=Xyrichtys novacula TaxID=13765 RepID=A0AAV1F462_XYRNO|nr:Hypothetical predicted protein [Xyrichtys novacula]
MEERRETRDVEALNFMKMFCENFLSRCSECESPGPPEDAGVQLKFFSMMETMTCCPSTDLLRPGGGGGGGGGGGKLFLKTWNLTEEEGEEGPGLQTD